MPRIKLIASAAPTINSFTDCYYSIKCIILIIVIIRWSKTCNLYLSVYSPVYLFLGFLPAVVNKDVQNRLRNLLHAATLNWHHCVTEGQIPRYEARSRHLGRPRERCKSLEKRLTGSRRANDLVIGWLGQCDQTDVGLVVSS